MFLKNHERVCPVCKKIFYVTDFNSWAYRANGKLFCRWNYLMKYEKEKGKKHENICGKCNHYCDKYGFTGCKITDKKRITYFKKACKLFEEEP